MYYCDAHEDDVDDDVAPLVTPDDALDDDDDFVHDDDSADDENVSGTGTSCLHRNHPGEAKLRLLK